MADLESAVRNVVDRRIEQARTHGQCDLLHRVAVVLSNMHTLETRLAAGELIDFHTLRAGALKDVAAELARLCADLKLEAPPALTRIYAKDGSR